MWTTLKESKSYYQARGPLVVQRVFLLIYVYIYQLIHRECIMQSTVRYQPAVPIVKNTASFKRNFLKKSRDDQSHGVEWVQVWASEAWPMQHKGEGNLKSGVFEYYSSRPSSHVVSATLHR